ncbi:NCS1 family transporter [Alkalihalobacillus sp. MEB130]|uniref:NCS1 family transporter n=1 Tax=Alkalihalobacillus sp. MEB130 TaxID=2976704 RepID=UPI0028DD8928|nr:NCS1 family transporter [Alkalihalobacillus sp. MEB130]MDT8862345.1 NCS1 family transporter [Alkalihalobacillus sp. MEB130]
MSNKSQFLKSPDLLPITQSGKKVNSLGFAFIWVGMAVVLAAFAIGGSGVASLSLGWVVLATVIGCVVLGLLMTLTGDIGVEHGLSFPVYMRAPFGTVGTHIPSVVRGIVASCWFGVNTFFGATAMNAILATLTSFDNWFVCFLIFAGLQVLNTALGIKAVERFADLAAPIIIIISGWMYMTLSDQALQNGREVWSWVENPVTGGAAFTAFMVVIMANMGFWGTLASDMPSISRFVKAPKFERNWFKRNKAQVAGNLIAYPIVQTFMVIIGAVSYIAVSNYDPVVALQQSASGVVLGILLLMIVLAQWSTNISANLIPAAVVFSNIGGPKVPFYIGVIAAGVIGIAVQPWSLFGIIIDMLLIIGAILSAVVGILIADYYLLRKRRVNVPDLYESEGQYKYANGINWAGFLSWIIGGGIALFFPTYSFLVGFFLGGVSYYILAKYWWFPKYEQAEIVDPSDEKYLGITVGKDWEIEVETKAEEEIAAAVAK